MLLLLSGALRTNVYVLQSRCSAHCCGLQQGAHRMRQPHYHIAVCRCSLDWRVTGKAGNAAAAALHHAHAAALRQRAILESHAWQRPVLGGSPLSPEEAGSIQCAQWDSCGELLVAGGCCEGRHRRWAAAVTCHVPLGMARALLLLLLASIPCALQQPTVHDPPLIPLRRAPSLRRRQRGRAAHRAQRRRTGEGGLGAHAAATSAAGGGHCRPAAAARHAHAQAASGAVEPGGRERGGGGVGGHTAAPPVRPAAHAGGVCVCVCVCVCLGVWVGGVCVCVCMGGGRVGEGARSRSLAGSQRPRSAGLGQPCLVGSAGGAGLPDLHGPQCMQDAWRHSRPATQKARSLLALPKSACLRPIPMGPACRASHGRCSSRRSNRPALGWRAARP